MTALQEKEQRFTSGFRPKMKFTLRGRPERGLARPKQCEEASPKGALGLLPSGERLDRRQPRAVRFRTVKEHFGRRRDNASASSDPIPDNLSKSPPD